MSPATDGDRAVTYSAVMRHALVAALVAALLTAAYLLLVAEPTIDDAIRHEEAAHAAHQSAAADVPLFTRHEQQSGGAVAVLLFGAAAAVVLGTVYAAVRHRMTAASELRKVLILGAVAFVTTGLVPALRYPANPPGVGNPSTIDQRTWQYVALVAFSVIAAVLLAMLSGRLRARYPDATRLVLLAIAAVAICGAALLVFPPSPDAVDPSMPAQLIWRFRVESLGALALFWAAFALGFGWLVEAAEHRAAAARRLTV